jgi:DNA-binding NarL/FixJ family response regulator
VGEAATGLEAIYQAEQLRPEVVLMDIIMPQKDGIEATAELKQCLPGVRVIMLTSYHETGRVKAALKAGAQGYLLKDTEGDGLLQAIEAVKKGGTPLDPFVTHDLMRAISPTEANVLTSLTQREKEILQLISRGLSNKGIALALNLSPGTVKAHVSHVLNKLNAHNRAEAIRWAAQHDLISFS